MSFSNQKTLDNLIRIQIKESFDLLWVIAQNILHFWSISSVALEYNVEIIDRSNDRQGYWLFFEILCSLAWPLVEIERDIGLGRSLDCIAQILFSFSSNPKSVKSMVLRSSFRNPIEFFNQQISIFDLAADRERHSLMLKNLLIFV